MLAITCFLIAAILDGVRYYFIVVFDKNSPVATDI
jgi:hypothetical protein